jgi:hypothetical protein
LHDRRWGGRWWGWRRWGVGGGGEEEVGGGLGGDLGRAESEDVRRLELARVGELVVHDHGVGTHLTDGDDRTELPWAATDPADGDDDRPGGVLGDDRLYRRTGLEDRYDHRAGQACRQWPPDAPRHLSGGQRWLVLQFKHQWRGRQCDRAAGGHRPPRGPKPARLPVHRAIGMDG